ncbi:HU family DNA-binding protein [Nostoc spongiaeforme]|nr:HU family DNA-binding protein [Nostoc spongiaeforme]
MKPRKVSISPPKMSVDKKELVRRVQERLSKQNGAVEEIIDATIEEIYESLKQGDSVALRNFGTFYVRTGRECWVFKFNPSQRLRQAFGWSSTHKPKP